MSNLITTTSSIATFNNGLKKYTSERPVSDFSIKAPMLNYLPYDYWKSRYTQTRMTSVLTQYDYRLHYDYNKFGNEAAQERILYSIQLEKLKAGTYTFVFKIANVIGTKNTYNLDVMTNRYNQNYPNNMYQVITPFSIKDGIYCIPVSFCGDNPTLYIRSSNSAWSSIDWQFDIYIIGLFEGVINDMSSYRNLNVSNQAPKIVTTNQENILGDYVISNKICRHLSQLERHIASEDETYILTWR